MTLWPRIGQDKPDVTRRLGRDIVSPPLIFGRAFRWRHSTARDGILPLFRARALAAQMRGKYFADFYMPSRNSPV